MPFGLSGAPATFQKLMSSIFRPHERFVLCYLDDLCIFSRTPEEHLEHLRIVLTELRKYKLYAKLSKCCFAQPQLEFLGHTISGAGIAVSPRLVQAVRDYPTPTGVQQVQRLLGMANFARRSIAKLAEICAPLYALTSRTSKWEWTDVHDKALADLKHALCNAPLIAPPDFSQPFSINTDASDTALGAVLTQGAGPSERVIAYESRKLNQAEKNYPVHDRELLSVVHALRSWRHYLLGTPFTVTVKTDNTPTVSILTKKDLTPRQIRWSELLAEYDFTIQHIPGKDNAVADALSRMHSLTQLLLLSGGQARVNANMPGRSQSAVHTLAVVLRSSTATVSLTPRQKALLEAVKEAGQADPAYLEFLQDTKRGVLSSPFVLREGVLFHKHKHTLYIPSSILRRQLLSEAHDVPTAGHLGRDKTLARLQETFYWPYMDSEVREYVRTCPDCQRNKASNQKPLGLMQPHDIPSRNWGSVALDFMTDLPLTPEGFDTIACFTCIRSKMAHAVACKKTIDAKGAARLYIDNVFKLHGLPTELVSDRDPRFTSDFWSALFKALGTKLSMSTANHPQTDGITERFNRTLQEMLRAGVNTHQDDWAQLLPLAEFAYNSSVHTTTGFTPFFLNYGFNPDSPLTMLTAGITQQAITDHDAHTFAERMATLLETSRDNILKAQAKQAAQYNKHHREGSFQVGDMVMLSVSHFSNLPNLAEGASRKLSPVYFGPYKVTKVVSPLAYRLELPGAMRVHDVFHISKLKPYNHTDAFPERIDTRIPPPPEIVDGEEHFHVTAFRGVRGPSARPRAYLVEFTGFGSEHLEWIPIQQLQEDLSADAFERLEREFKEWQTGRQRALGARGAKKGRTGRT